MRDGVNSLAIDPKVTELIGGGDSLFSETLVGQLANATSTGGKASEEGINFALSVIAGIEPKDKLEAMLGAQMATVHMQIMTSSRKLNNTETIQQYELHERTLNKLMRTFAMQMDTLKRYRSKGEQRVYVERVNVESGAQAVIGDLHAAVRGGRGA